MPNSASRVIKIALSRAGWRSGSKASRAVALASGYFQVGNWLRAQGFKPEPAVRGREQVFAAMAQAVAHSQVLYVEFGVFQGASLRWWSNALDHPKSELHGFDSFEGLPETFDDTYQRGHFDQKGKPPDIADDRITFHVGWFDVTVPGFEIPDHDRLVVTLDADLYSSTKLALEHLAAAIKPGTILYFDELSRVDHEPAAFADFIQKYNRTFKVLAIEDTFNTVAFICTG